MKSMLSLSCRDRKNSNIVNLIRKIIESGGISEFLYWKC